MKRVGRLTSALPTRKFPNCADPLTKAGDVDIHRGVPALRPLRSSIAIAQEEYDEHESAVIKRNLPPVYLSLW